MMVVSCAFFSLIPVQATLTSIQDPEHKIMKTSLLIPLQSSLDLAEIWYAVGAWWFDKHKVTQLRLIVEGRQLSSVYFVG